MIRRIEVAGYRSIREMSLPLRPVNVLTGPNGCGKSNLYNSLVLIGRAAEGALSMAIVEEGGMSSVFWAGGERIRYQRKRPPVRMTLGFEGSDLGYEIQVGLPAWNEHALGTLFTLDPRVKEESIWPTGNRRVELMKRDGPSAWLRDSEGNRVAYPFAMSKHEAILSRIAEPHRYPELSAVRTLVAGWRFYHHFRTDAESPMRQPRIGVTTHVLSRSGSDLAAALRTVQEVGDEAALARAVAEAFGGAELRIEAPDMMFRASLRVPGLLRPLDAREFSDGQLRFLCLCAALLSPRPPALLALNEPETSLHPGLIAPLAGLIAQASKHTQLWITTHSTALADLVERHTGVERVRLTMRDGETLVDS